MGVNRLVKWMNKWFGGCSRANKEDVLEQQRLRRSNSRPRQDTDELVVPDAGGRQLKRKQSMFLAPDADLTFHTAPIVRRDEDILMGYGWKLCWFIGEGAMSKVRSAQRISDGKRAAVKVIDKRTLSEKCLQHHLPNEKKIMKDIEHPNVVSTFDLVETENKLYIFMELMERGDMYNMIEKMQRLTASETRHYFRQLVQGVRYLHETGIAHRDLKLENVLMDKEKRLKVTDFGFSRYTEPGSLCDTVCGTPGYCAPEVYRGESYDPLLADLYALGVCLFIMLVGKYPFERELSIPTVVSKQEASDFSLPPTVRGMLHKDCVRFVHELLAPVPQDRISLETMMQSDWLRDDS